MIESLLLLGLIAAALGLRRLGPLAGWEVVRAARGGRLVRTRFFYALLLLVVFLVLYARICGDPANPVSLHGDVPRKRAEVFVTAFAITVLLLQYLLVLVVGPLIAGGSIAGERERGTLDLLRTTDLSAAEIVLGKVAASAARLLHLWLVGLPFVALVVLLGGLSPGLVMVSSAATLLTAVSVSAVGVAVSAYHDRARRGVVYALAAVGAYQVLASGTILIRYAGGWWIDWAPVEIFRFLTAGSAAGLGVPLFLAARSGSLEDEIVATFVWMVLFHAAVTVVAVLVAMWRLRTFDPARQPQAAGNPTSLEIETVQDSWPGPPPPPPLDDRPPMQWKERYCEQDPRALGGPNTIRHELVGFGIFAVVMFYIGLWVAMWQLGLALDALANTWARICTVAGMLLILTGLVLRSAPTLARERERRTLESLLVTDLTDAEILGAKWRACLWTERVPAGLLVGVWMVACLTGGLNVLALPAQAAVCAAQAAFAISLGMFCSLVFDGAVRATVAAVLLFAAVVLGHWVPGLIVQTVLESLGLVKAAGMLDTFELYGLTMPMSEFIVGFRAKDFETVWELDSNRGVLAALAGAALYAALAWLLWRIVRRRFRRSVE